MLQYVLRGEKSGLYVEASRVQVKVEVIRRHNRSRALKNAGLLQVDV